jgi:hypothetical protein
LLVVGLLLLLLALPFFLSWVQITLTRLPACPPAVIRS